MEPTFLTLVLVCSVLALIQLAAALPWLAAINFRSFLNLTRQFYVWIGGAGGIVGGGLLMAAFSEGSADNWLTRYGRIYGAILQAQLIADFFVLVFALMLWLWPKGGAVALSAFRESLRQPMFWLLFIISLFL